MFQAGLHVIDAATFQQVGFLKTGPDAHGLYLSRAGRLLYVSNRGNGTISVIDLAQRQVIATWYLPGGGSPDMDGSVRTAKDSGCQVVTTRPSTPSPPSTGTSSPRSMCRTSHTAYASGGNRAGTHSGTPATCADRRTMRRIGRPFLTGGTCPARGRRGATT